MTGLAAYAPALDGEFISDDQHYVHGNPYLHELSLENLREILDPRGALTVVVENYAPVHLLLHALEWQAFGPAVRGYHVVNVLLHALACLLFVVLMIRTGLPPPLAALCGALFLVHPANVEAVAWISQLKSPAALCLALGALLLHPARPVAAAILFTLGLFAKPSALFALPVLVVWTWLTPPAGERQPGEARRWLWPAVWAGLFVAFALVELAAFSVTAGTARGLYEEPLVRLRSSAAIGARYLAMTATGQGLSTFHEPPPASWLDPWWLAALPALGLVVWRTVHALRRRSPEGLFWIWAAASYAPVSGALTLPFPMADRYLYGILPGLLGAAGFVALDLGRWLREAQGERRAQQLGWVALAGACALTAFFAAESHARARLWQSGHRVIVDAALHYPDGSAAHLRSAGLAARNRDAKAAIEHLAAARERGLLRLETLVYDPSFAFLREDPRYQRLLQETADERLALYLRNPDPSQPELLAIAIAYRAKGDLDRAIDALERALEVGGPAEERVRAELRELTAARRRQSLRGERTR